MIIDRNLLAQARQALEKLAFAPMPPTPPPQQAPPVDPQQLMQLMQDPKVQQLLQQQGIQVTPQGPVDQQGQPVPPEAIAQILSQAGLMPGMPGPAGQAPEQGAPGQAPQGGADPAAGQQQQQGGQVDVQALMQAMQDPQVQQLLQQQGITLGQQGPVDQQGQVVPPEAIAQLLQQAGVPVGGQPQQGQPQPGQPPAQPGAAPAGQPMPQGQPQQSPGMPMGPPITLDMLMSVMPQILDAHEAQQKQRDGRIDAEQLAARMDDLERIMAAISNKLGMSPGELGMGQGEGPAVSKEPGMGAEQAEQAGMNVQASEDEISANLDTSEDAEQAGPSNDVQGADGFTQEAKEAAGIALPPKPTIPPAIPKTASDRGMPRPAARIMAIMARMNAVARQ